jgi:hypothetical protein
MPFIRVEARYPLCRRYCGKGSALAEVARSPNALNQGCKVRGEHEIVRSHCDKALVITGGS